jgi:hypothetical protein
VVGFTTVSRGEVPGKKENLWQEIMMMIIIIIIIQRSAIIGVWIVSRGRSPDHLQLNITIVLAC